MEFNKIDILKTNAARISARIKTELKENKINNVALGYELGYTKDTISRKINNKNDMYFNSDDIRAISKLINCRYEYLICEDNFKNDDDILKHEKNKLKKDFVNAIYYLRSIGIYLHPGIFWVGDARAFVNAKKEIMPYLDTWSINYIKQNEKMIVADANKTNTIRKTLVLPLNDKPIEYIDGIEKLTKNNDDVKTYHFVNNSWKNGYYEMRFFIYFDKPNENNIPPTISIDDANKLFSFMDNIVKSSIKELLKNSLSDYKSQV